MELDRDRIDVVLEQWEARRPDVDLRALGVLGRLYRLSRHVERSVDNKLGRFGIDGADLEILEALERSGSDGRLSPTELSDTVMMTSGGMSGRLDRLRRAGLVKRQPDPVDRRSVFVVLTSKGRETVRRVLPLHAEAAQECLQSLSPEKVASLEELLRGMLLGFEGGLSEKDWIWSEG
ncbi:MAG TPA: MarR family transcriptional regulator [Actinomycetota bacterium]|jgi:DNA-binding MarR family transcriptional regulator